MPTSKPRFGQTPLNWRYQEDLSNIASRLSSYGIADRSRLFELGMTQQKRQDTFKDIQFDENLAIRKYGQRLGQSLRDKMFSERYGSSQSEFFKTFLPAITESYMYSKRKSKMKDLSDQQALYSRDLAAQISPEYYGNPYLEEARSLHDTLGGY